MMLLGINNIHKQGWIRRLNSKKCSFCTDILNELLFIDHPIVSKYLRMYMSKIDRKSFIFKYPPLLGMRFGKLLAVDYDNNKYICKCDCGNTKSVSMYNLSNTRSCGCLRKTGRKVFKPRSYTDKEYIEWRKQVFKRDNYTCQLCNDATGGNLNAHHIYHWKDYKYLRYDVDNGITLCVGCHRLIHSKKYNKQPSIVLYLRDLL